MFRPNTGVAMLPLSRQFAKLHLSFAAWKSLRCIQGASCYSGTHANALADSSIKINPNEDLKMQSPVAFRLDGQQEVLRRLTKRKKKLAIMEKGDQTSLHQRRFLEFRTLRKQEIMAILSKPTGAVIGNDEADHDTFHYSCFIGKTVTDELKSTIKLLLDEGIDAGLLNGSLFSQSGALIRIKIKILYDYTVKVSARTLLKFNQVMNVSLKQLQASGYLDDPQMAIKNIIKNLPIKEEDVNYLLGHPSFDHDQAGCYSLTCLGNEIVNIYTMYKLPSRETALNIFYSKKFRRLHDSIRCIDLLASPEYAGQGCPDKIITHGNPVLLEFFAKNPSYLRGLPTSMLFKSQNSFIMWRSVEELVSRMDLYFNKLQFEPQTLHSMDVFGIPPEELIERSNYWFKFFGQEQMRKTPKSSKMLCNFDHYKHKYSLVRPDCLNEDATIDQFDEIKLLLSDKSMKANNYLKSVYDELGWDFSQVKKRLKKDVLAKVLKIDSSDLKYYDARKIANYLLEDIKFTAEQVMAVPVILCLKFETVKQIHEKFKEQIEAPEWKHHPLVLDYVLFSFFNERSDIDCSVFDVD